MCRRLAGHRHLRVEWLLDGLVHDAPEIRADAASELAQLTGTTFGYSHDLPEDQRAEIRERYAAWWADNAWAAADSRLIEEIELGYAAMHAATGASALAWGSPSWRTTSRAPLRLSLT